MLTKINFVWIKKPKTKDEVSYSKSLAKRKYYPLKATRNQVAFYCDQISSYNNPVNPNYHLL